MENTTAIAPSSTEALTTPVPTLSLKLGQFEGRPLNFSSQVALLVAGWLAFLSGVFGNILVISTILCERALRCRKVNLYIVNLAVADLLIMGYVVPYWLLDLSWGYQPVENKTHCDANAFIAVVAAGASIYSLVLINFDRYIRVCHIKVYVKFASRGKVLASCVGVWIVSTGAGFVPLFRLANTTFIYNPSVRTCTFGAVDPNNLFSVLSCINLVVPVALISFFSISILLDWKSSRNRIRQWTQSQDGWRVASSVQSQSSRLSASETALIRSLFLVFFLLAIFYFPMVVALTTSGRVYISTDWYNGIVLFYFLNHSVNWIVYGAFNTTFKTGYKRLMTGKCFNSSLRSVIDN